MLFLKLTLAKLYNAVLSGSILATVALFLEPLRKLVTDELSFFSMLTMAIIIDWVIGVMKYWKINEFSFKNMLIGLMIKVAVAYGGMLMFLAFQSLDPGIASEWFGLIAKFTVLLYPAGSAFSNMYIITGGKFPPVGFMKKLKSFNDSLSPSDVVPVKENSNGKN